MREPIKRRLPTGQEARKAVRYEAEMPAVLKFQGIRGTIEEVTFATKDVSATGIALEVDRPLPVGEILNADLALLDDTLVAGLRCEVRWCRKSVDSANGGYQAGLLFVAPTDEQLRDLREFFRTYILRQWDKK